MSFAIVARSYSAGDLEVFLRFNNNSGSVYTIAPFGYWLYNGFCNWARHKIVFRCYPGATASNTFGNFSIYIPNYAGSTAKSVSQILVSRK
jgi:hypothetical protein